MNFSDGNVSIFLTPKDGCHRVSILISGVYVGTTKMYYYKGKIINNCSSDEEFERLIKLIPFF